MVTERKSDHEQPATAKYNWPTLVLPLVSAVVVALIGAGFTYAYNQQQIRSARLETVSKFMDMLNSNDQRKQEIAILAISTLGDEDLAVRLASVLPTDGSSSVLQRLLIEAARTRDHHLLRLIGRTGAAGELFFDSRGMSAMHFAVLNDDAESAFACRRGD
jgi:hypothetical protein